MPSLLRHRRATAVLAALFAGAPPLVSGIAVADPSPAPGAPARQGGHEIVFSGGAPLGLRCAAKPNAASVTVPAEGTLRVVNDTGRRARLLLDGVAQGEIAGRSSGDVLFHRGPVSLALRPNCLFASQSAARVDVAAPSAARPSATPSTGRGTGGPAGAGSPSAAGQPPAPAMADGPAAEPMGSVEPLSDGEPIGLLALTATVCVVGVSAGAIRAIMAQRITRTLVA